MIRFILQLKSEAQNAGFGVLTVMVMKSPVFWGTALCSLLKVNNILERFFTSILVKSSKLLCHAGFRFPYSTALKMVATYSSRMLAAFELTK
jgi:hypothetical protein